MLLLSCSRLTRGFDEGPLFEDVGFELYAAPVPAARLQGLLDEIERMVTA